MISLNCKNIIFVNDLKTGDEFITCFKKFCTTNGINSAFFSFIGAFSEAVITEYDQKNKKYLEPLILKENLEILSLIGNVSYKDNDVFIHAHVSLSSDKGKKTYGGHLLEAKIFALEGFLFNFDNQLKRNFDDTTKLFLIG